MPEQRTRVRIGVDIGGTFTDIAVADGDGALTTFKTLTTPETPETGFLSGISSALERAGHTPADVGVIIHGTTLATNALIERRGALTALLVTEGHRDTLEIGYENRVEQYDINIDRPRPLVPRRLRLPITERIGARGQVLAPLDERSVARALDVIDSAGVESVAIGFLHAYANPAHEQRVAEIISSSRPHVSITLASEIAPEIREYERQTTAVANAYVQPLMRRYLQRLEEGLRTDGFLCPFLLMTSGGGLSTPAAAAHMPIRLVESGPAGGAVLAAALARSLDCPHVLSFDMGGTTAKMCLVDDFAPSSARQFEVDRQYRFRKGSGIPLRIPVIEMVEIGAGGGSLARVDDLQRLVVGPESAGAAPGPACYQRGGDRPTVTDADLVLGRITPERFAGGAIPLDAVAATDALHRHIGAPLGLSADEAAAGVCEVVEETMAAAARAHAAEHGVDVSGRPIIAFGGAAPLHAARLAEKLGAPAIIIPPGAGVGSAIGFLLAPASYEVVRSLPMTLDAFDCDRVQRMLQQMGDEATGLVRAVEPQATLTTTTTAAMRYVGQGAEIAVVIAADPFGVEGLRDSFEAAYRGRFGRIIPGMPVEVLTWSVRVCGPAPSIPPATLGAFSRPVKPERHRPVFDAARGVRINYALVERSALAPGDRVLGPALIAEAQTTVVVTDRFDAQLDSAGNLHLLLRPVHERA